MLNSIDDLDSLDEKNRLFVAVQSSPSLLRGLGELKRPGQARASRSAFPWSANVPKVEPQLVRIGTESLAAIPKSAAASAGATPVALIPSSCQLLDRLAYRLHREPLITETLVQRSEPFCPRA